MLKLFIATLLCSFLSANFYAQTTAEKVEDFLGVDRYTVFQQTNPGLIDFLTVKAEEGYSVNNSVDEKKSSYVQIEYVYFRKTQLTMDQFIQELQSDSFNFLNYTFPNHDTSKTTHYLLGDSEILLTVYSNAVLNNKVALR